ncbi:MAG: drug/metabolite transporter (DMT)-like permease [Kiritimatiellia bacterium]|jgi:drug/metabolite transporter (DMT)-like permease
MNVGLYLATVLIWGTTWIAIHLQLGSVEAFASIFYRFAIAGALFLPLMIIFKRLQPTCRRDHFFFLLQGACLFSMNYVCMYTASGYIISGLMSVVFAFAALFNAFNQWLIWRKKPSKSIYVASVLGVVGLALLFWPQLQIEQDIERVLYGLLLTAVGTYFFSLGNMVSVRNSHQGIKPWTSNAYSMIYGAVLMGLIVLALDIPLGWDSSSTYVGSLIYLVVPGTMIGFTIYLVLVARIGADKAAYTTVLFPIVALTISTFVEAYQWSVMAVLGLVLVMLGVLMSSRGPQLLDFFQRHGLYYYRLLFVSR